MSHIMWLARVEEDHSASFIEEATVEPSFLEEALGCDLTAASDTTQCGLEDADEFRTHIQNNSF
ncbi:hypothetical protein [Halorubrum sp. BV1]|uniref:hypothetical protein n=1 Tax=Halorubrum sp. BV1 TaxID=1498500 RepID=UPI00067929E8|nr:hypothetical protein [Halorubrum sp. BV1]